MEGKRAVVLLLLAYAILTVTYYVIHPENISFYPGQHRSDQTGAYFGVNKTTDNSMFELQQPNSNNWKYVPKGYNFQQAALAQYKHFWSQNPKLQESRRNKIFTDTKEYTYLIEREELKMVNDLYYMQIDISEWYLNRTTGGGAGMRIICTTCGSRLLSICPVVDLFNGSYVVQCQLYTQCNILQITVNYIKFQQYHKWSMPLQNIIYRKLICFSSKAHAQLKTLYRDMLNTDSGDCGNTPGVATPNNVWQKDDKLYIWNTNITEYKWVTNGDVMPFFKPSEVKSCVGEYNEIYLLGASHMRYLSDFMMMHGVGPLPVDISYTHRDFHMGNINYYWCANGKDYPGKIKMILGQISKRQKVKSNVSANSNHQRPILFVLQTGSRDLDDTSKNLMTILDKFISAIKVLLNVNFKMKLIVLPSPSLPDYPTNRKQRNNFLIGAYAGAMKNRVSQLGVTFIDTFEITYALKNHQPVSPNQIHYYVMINSTEMSGFVGETAIHVMLRETCKMN